MIKSICIVRLSALGDVLMALPLARLLQKHYPEASLSWVISRPAFDLVEGISDIEWIVIDKPNSIRDYWRFSKRMKGRHFDVLLAIQASFRANLLYPLISASRKIGYDALRAKDGHRWFVRETIRPGNDHTLEGFLKFAEPLGVSDKTVTWNIPISPEDEAFAKTYIPEEKRVMIVNPEASKPERSWDIERYCEVISKVRDEWGLDVILTGGPFPRDQEKAALITKKLPFVQNLVGKTKPKQLLALIRRARFVLCPDTGPSHMASAVGTPVVALHAVTSKDVSGPWPYRDFAVDCYDEAVRLVFNQERENIPWGTHVHGDQAMKLVTVEAALQKVHEVMAI